MRLFIAIDLPEVLKKYLREVQKKLPPAGFSFARDFHLTLKFLGECSPQRKERIEEALATLPSFTSFQATLGPAGTFGGISPRVVWLSVQAPPVLKELAQAVEKKISSLGFSREHRFVPHITLARMKKTKIPPGDFLKTMQPIPLSSHSFPVSEYHLFLSELQGAKGSVHTKLKTFPLGLTS